jgi:quercetin dioxygenase-like cupin family protein
MIVKKDQREKRLFKGVDYLVGATGERMMVTKMLFKQGQEVASHSHPNEQSGYCVSGRFEITIDKVTAEIGPDDTYVIPGGVPHSYRILEDAIAVEVFSPPRGKPPQVR